MALSVKKNSVYISMLKVLYYKRASNHYRINSKLVNSDSMFFRKVQLHERKLKHINKPWNLARISKI